VVVRHHGQEVADLGSPWRSIPQPRSGVLRLRPGTLGNAARRSRRMKKPRREVRRETKKRRAGFSLRRGVRTAS
jgi:hypothetical protein